MAGAKIRDWTLWGGKRFLLPKVIPESPAGGGGGGTRSAKERNKRSMYPPHVLTLTCKAYVRGVKSFVDDLNEPGIVRCGVALLPRPAEIKPAIHRFISHFLFFFFTISEKRQDFSGYWRAKRVFDLFSRAGLVLIPMFLALGSN
jgi:hypothetical protein